MTNELPMDGTEFDAIVVSRIPYRYKLYKPSSNEAKSGIKGRWQRMNDYGGWDNTDTPPTRATPQVDVEKLKRNSCHYFRKTGQYCSDGCFVCEQDIGYNQAIDHLAAQYDFVPKNGGK